MELKDTVDLMLSDDRVDRFKAEYYQVKIRLDSLRRMLAQNEAGVLGYELPCPIAVYKIQINHMTDYMYSLEIRAAKEGIEL